MTLSLISPAFAVLPLLLSCSPSCWCTHCPILSVLLYDLLVYLEELLTFSSAQVLSISSQIKLKLKPQGKKKEIKYTSLAEDLFPFPALNAGALQALCFFTLCYPAYTLLVSHSVSLSFWGASCLSFCAMPSPCSWQSLLLRWFSTSCFKPSISSP